MPNLNIFDFFKKIFSDRKFISVFLTSLVSIIIILAIAVGIVWHYRANIFGRFAREYLLELQNGSSGELSVDKTNGQQTLLPQESLVVDAVKKTNPAVVSIIISQDVPKYIVNNSPDQGTNPFGNLFPGLPNFFFNAPQYQQNGTQEQEVGGGSGFLVTSDGLIVTNKHVVDQSGASYTVYTNDGKKHSAKIIAKDPVLDIALIKIDGTGYPYLSLGDSTSLQVGQSVIAIGNALGEFRNTVSVGVVSGLARSITAGDLTGSSETLDNVIQTDAAINPGNSGGPLLDLSGNVIGVNVALAQGSENIGFALPINSIKSAVSSVEATGKIVRPYLGVRYISINDDIKNKNNLSVDYGALVKGDSSKNELAVIPGSPADKAGIMENDIILEVDGVKVDQNNSLASLISQKNVGEIITLKISHKGVEKTIQATLEVAKNT